MDGKTSPEELAAATHSACYAMALALRLGERKSMTQWTFGPAVGRPC